MGGRRRLGLSRLNCEREFSVELGLACWKRRRVLVEEGGLDRSIR